MNKQRLGKGAQRLSASTKEPLRAYRSRSTTENVLNAFRHQRKNHTRSNTTSRRTKKCSTPFGINERTTPSAVVDRRDIQSCSTPFGINERTTSRHSEPSSPVAVLNAFRHQRKNHFLPPRKCLQSETCSTPFGINERTTRTQTSQMLSSCLCSTPFGINERTTQDLTGGEVMQETVLNAFRHQRKNHTAGSICAPIAATCAQRLSASTKEPQNEDEEVDGPEKCSTPFGINERTTNFRRHSSRPRLRCSTPFGINERTTRSSQRGRLDR